MDKLTPEEAALQALKSLPRLKARSEVRSRARALFAEGRDAGGIRAIGRPRSFFSRFGPLAVAAAIGVIIVGLFFYGAQPAGRWFVVEAVAPEGITDGAANVSAGVALSRGSLRTGPESELAVQLTDRLQFRMLPGTEIELPPPPGRWFNKARTIRVIKGEIYGTTAHGGPGFSVTIETPEAAGTLLGTTFATFRNEDGTCFCLWTGGIEVVSARDSRKVLVPVEHKFYVYKDGSTSEILPLDDRERMKLSMTHDAGLASISPTEP